MKETILQNLFAVLNALNNISVSGKQNLGNLSGSIAVIEEITGMLEGADVISKEQKEEKADET